MTLQNDFILFGNSATNIVSQAAYAADPNTAGGRPSGIWPSNVANKILRQGSYASAALAELINTFAGQSAVDNGNLTTFTTSLIAALQAVAASGTPTALPGGRLTLTTGTPVIAADVTASTVVYYTPTVSASLPIFNGTYWTNPQLTGDLTLSLTSAAASNDLVDVFACYNSLGAPVLGFGPVWATNTAGSGSRGTGAGTTQISRVNNGIWVNTNIITLTNGANTYANIPIGEATYLGTLAIDATAGQVSCYVSQGQSRKWGVWNAYNRRRIIGLVADSTANWTYNITTWRASNGNSSNNFLVCVGLPEENLDVEFIQAIQNSYSVGTNYNGIGLNSTTTPTGRQGSMQITAAAFGSDVIAKAIIQPFIGLNQLNCLEYGNSGSTTTYFGGTTRMALACSYFG